MNGAPPLPPLPPLAPPLPPLPPPPLPALPPLAAVAPPLPPLPPLPATWWQKLIALIVSLLVTAGVGAALEIGVFALSASLNISIFFTILGCLVLLITFVLSIYGTTGSVHRAYAINVFLAFTGFLLVFSFVQQLRMHPAGGVFIGMGVILIVVILLAWRNPNWLAGLNDFGNAQKAFGGTTFAEFASFIGVVGALGSHAGLASDAQGWFWLAQFGTLVVFAAAGSLFWRYLRFEDDPVPGYLTIVLVFATLISLAMLPELTNWYIFGVWAALIGALILFMIVASHKSRTLRADNQWGGANHTAIQGGERFFLILVTSFVVISGIAYLVLALLPMIGVSFRAPALVPIIFITIAQVCWLATEGWNIIVKRGQPWANNALNYHEWEKNIWNILSALTLIFFTLAPLWNPSPLPLDLNYIFLLGIAFGLLGTLRGILVGMIKKYG
jgi:hypothetical protein